MPLFVVSLEIFAVRGLEFTVCPVYAGRCRSYLPWAPPIGFASPFFLVDGSQVQDENLPLVGESSQGQPPGVWMLCFRQNISALLQASRWFWSFSGLPCRGGFLFCLALSLMPRTHVWRRLLSFLLFSCPYPVTTWFTDFSLRTILLEVEQLSFALCLFSQLSFFSVHLDHVPLPCSSQDHSLGCVGTQEDTANVLCF